MPTNNTMRNENNHISFPISDGELMNCAAEDLDDLDDWMRGQEEQSVLRSNKTLEMRNKLCNVQDLVNGCIYALQNKECPDLSNTVINILHFYVLNELQTVSKELQEL